MTDSSWTQVKAAIAHIEGEKPGSARYNAAMSESDRQGYENLLLLCPNHHREVDSLTPDEYPVKTLREIKAAHEAACRRPWATDAELAVFVHYLLSLQSQPEAPDPSAVAWDLTKGTGYNFLLRNIGRETAHSVRIDPAQIMAGVMHRGLPDGIDILAGASHTFLVQGTWGKSLPGEFWITWDGGPFDGVPVFRLRRASRDIWEVAGLSVFPFRLIAAGGCPKPLLLLIIGLAQPVPSV